MKKMVVTGGGKSQVATVKGMGKQGRTKAGPRSPEISQNSVQNCLFALFFLGREL